jgi:hypothetical protein
LFQPTNNHEYQRVELGKRSPEMDLNPFEVGPVDVTAE